MTTSADDLRALATAVRDDLGLRGAWRWFGDVKHGNYSLATVHHGRRFVLRFARKGMREAQPVFPTPSQTYPGQVAMRKASEIPVFEVAPHATDPDDPALYRHDVRGFRSPVADYLAALDADTVLGLLDQIDRLQAVLGEEPPPAHEVIHACPLGDSGIMACCGRTPFQALHDRMTTYPRLVTCQGAPDA